MTQTLSLSILIRIVSSQLCSFSQIQDTIPVHAARLSQELALQCMQKYYPLNPHSAVTTDVDDSNHSLPSTNTSGIHLASTYYSEWARVTVGSLVAVREALWPVLAPLGTVYTKGAFYFLVPVPAEVRSQRQCYLATMLIV